MGLQPDFISEIRLCSPNIASYLDNKLYRADVEDPDILTESVIFNLVMNMVIDELGIMGIIIHARNEVYNEVSLIKTIEFLRVSFDIKNFSPLVARTPSLGQFVCASADSEEADPELFVHDVIRFCQDSFPLSTKWEHLIKNEEYFTSKPEFMDHVCRISENAQTLTAQIDFDHLVPKFLNSVLEHVTKVNEHARFLATHPSTDDLAAVEEFMKKVAKHCQELPSVMPSQYIENYLDVDDPHPAYSARGSDHPDILKYKQSKNVFLEYYRTHPQIDEISAETAMIIVSDLFRPTWGIDKNLESLRVLYKTTNLGNGILRHLEHMMQLLSTRSAA
jgi:hypothetical protein